MLEGVPKELSELSKLYAHLLVTIDGLWFLEVEKSRGLDEAVKLDENVWRNFGRYEGKRIKELLGIETVSNIEDFSKILLLTPMMVRMEPKVEIHDNRLFMSVTDCKPQQARVRKGLGEFPCKSVSLAWFEGIAPELGSQIRFKCHFCPPDQHPSDLWCKWEVWIEQN